VFTRCYLSPSARAGTPTLGLYVARAQLRRCAQSLLLYTRQCIQIQPRLDRAKFLKPCILPHDLVNTDRSCARPCRRPCTRPATPGAPLMPIQHAPPASTTPPRPAPPTCTTLSLVRSTVETAAPTLSALHGALPLQHRPCPSSCHCTVIGVDNGLTHALVQYARPIHRRASTKLM